MARAGPLWVGTYSGSVCPFLIAVLMLDPASEEASQVYCSLHAQPTSLQCGLSSCCHLLAESVRDTTEPFRAIG